MCGRLSGSRSRRTQGVPRRRTRDERRVAVIAPIFYRSGRIGQWKDAPMAGNVSTPGRQRHQSGAGAARAPSTRSTAGSRSPSSPSGPGCPSPTAHRLVGELVDLGRAEPHGVGGVRRGPATVGRRTARPRADRTAPAGLAVPARPLRRHPGHRAPRRARRAPRCSTSTGSPATPRCRWSARSARGCRCTPPASARCCWPTRRRPSRPRCSANLTRITPYTIIQPGTLRRQLARVLRDDYATTVEEMSLGACSVGVPIRARGDVVAALGIVVPSLKKDRARAGDRDAGGRAQHRPRPGRSRRLGRPVPLSGRWSS